MSDRTARPFIFLKPVAAQTSPGGTTEKLEMRSDVFPNLDLFYSREIPCKPLW